MTPFTNKLLRLDTDAASLRAMSMHLVEKLPTVPVIVVTAGTMRDERSQINVTLIHLYGDERRLWCHPTTGTLYDAETGACLSSDRRRLDWPGVEPESPIKVVSPDPAKFIINQPGVSEKPKRWRDPAKPRRAKVGIEEVRMVRAKKSDGTYMYPQGALMKNLGVGKTTITDIRSGQTWRGVA